MVKQNIMPINRLTSEQIASICDHTFLLRSEAFKEKSEVEGAVELRELNFKYFLEKTDSLDFIPYALCVRPEDVYFTKNYIKESQNLENSKVASVVGFPDGSWYSTEFKIAETNLALDSGAEEIDMVINYDALKDNDNYLVKNDISKVVEVAHERNALVKLILETSELEKEEIKKACYIASEEDVDFIKTSTGFGAYGAKPEDLVVMRKYFNKGIKISGGVNPNNVKDLLFAASDRKDGYIDLNPMKIRIGESSLLDKL